MNLNFKINSDFLADYKQLIFSVVIIIFIPALIVFNTYYIVNALQDNMDFELRDKAIMAAEGLNVSLLDSLGDKEEIKNKIDEYSKLTENVKKITIIEKDNDEFRVVSNLGTEEEKIEDNTVNVLAWFGDDPIAKLVVATKDEKIGDKQIYLGERFWSVTLPIENQSGEKVYLTNIWVSLSDIDTLMSKTITNAGFILFVSIIVILLMVASNGQLFKYSILFQKLKEVDQMKDDFISIASHELRTPLTAIKGYVSLIEDDEKERRMSKEQKTKMLDGITVSADRLDALVSDILDVSRIEQNRIKLEIGKVGFVEVSKKVVGQLRVEAKSKNLKLIENYPKNEIYSSLDKGKLEQILINLIGNSLKYTLEGEIEVTLSTEKDNNVINVRDTGIGMNEEERKQLFTKFYRVQSEETRDVVGTGLGLWITKQLVETMGGKIMVDSIKNVGTQFTVTFPVSKES